METIEDLKARIAAKKAAIEAKQLQPERDERSRLESEAAFLDALELAQEAHGAVVEGLCIVEHNGEKLAIFKRPSAGEYRRFTDSKMAAVDTLRLVSRCRVHPDAPAFDRILDRWPGLLDQLGLQVAALAGNRKASEALEGK